MDSQGKMHVAKCTESTPPGFTITTNENETFSVKPVGDEPCVLADNGQGRWFDITLSKSHVSGKFTINLPRKMTNKLQCTVKHVKITNGTKSWIMEYYYVFPKCRRFRARDWKLFITDNNLTEGDQLFFEICQGEHARNVVHMFCVFLRNAPWMCPCVVSRLGSTDLKMETDEKTEEVLLGRTVRGYPVVDGVILID